MKKIIVVVLVALIAGVSSVYAQKKGNQVDRAAKHLETLDELLDLSEDQELKMETLFTQFSEDMKPIRNNEELSREEKKEAMDLQRESHNIEIEKVLTEEQLVIFNEHRAEMKESRKPGKQQGNRGPKMSDATKALILEKRVAFDAELTADEKETITSIRSQIETWQEACKTDERPDMEERKGNREKHQNVIKPLIEIAENHEVELRKISEEIKAEMDLPEQSKKGRKRHFAQQGKHARGMNIEKPERHQIHFLLMDPNEKSQNNTTTGKVIESIDIYPNPVQTSFTVAFEMQEEGPVTIELLNKYGGILEVLNTTNCNSGTNSFTYDASALAPAEVYFVKVSKPEAVVVEKLIKL